jgi:hypothetical protein
MDFIGIVILIIILVAIINGILGLFQSTAFITTIVVLLCLSVCWNIYKFFYFRSKKFLEIKESIKEHIDKCNDLNEHIEELKKSYIDIKSINYGKADYIDSSVYKYKRPELKKLRETKNVHSCSLSVCTNAKQQPFKYICKYFNIKANEETLSTFEMVLNNFSAAEQGKNLLKKERDNIVESINGKIPFLIRIFAKRKLVNKLGFTEIDFSKLYFPKYSFQYVSAGGKSAMTCSTVFHIENLNKFVAYLADLVKYKNSVTGQRALMTSALREKIKKRDNFTCRNCGLSTKQEPNLLLEIDHIIPLSKNGVTTEENLQTLCWRCNRMKGSKIVDNQ